jgi:eukaryotic-like serine/threonine-protein kinase
VSGPLLIDDVIAIARQLVDALDAAHEKGIVHRDLKPANIKITSAGFVKVLDFGLAKALTTEDESPSPTGSVSPTITAGLTREGTILGTSAYMSPEQTRGESVGRGADIWAFGCVVYEMITGRRAFPGETITETLAGVLKSEPEWTAFSGVPPALETLVRRCLEKNPRRRLHDIADASIWLDEAQRRQEKDPLPATTTSAVTAKRSSRLALAAVLSTVAVVAFGAGIGVVTSRQTAVPTIDAPTVRFDFTPPPNAPFTPAVTGGSMAISNDGSQLVYHTLVDDTFRLTLRRLDSLETTPVPGSNLARNPFFSPDGKRLGFIVGGVIKTIALDNGLQTTVAPIEGLGFATWSDDGTIAFEQPDGLYRVPESGGTPQLVLRPDQAKGEREFFSLSSLPGGALLFGTVARPQSNGRSHLSVLPRGATEAKTVLDGVLTAFYAQGALVYLQQKGLTASKFDLQRNEISGSPIVIEPRNTRTSARTFAQNGTIAYALEDGTSLLMRIALLSPDGKPIRTIADDLNFARHPRVSPDGRRLAVTIGGGNGGSVWTYDLSGAAQPLNLTAGAGGAELPVWRLDGRQIDIVWRRVAWSIASVPTDSGALAPTALIAGGNETLPQDWSLDGKALLYQVTNVSGGTDIMTFDPASKKSLPWLQTSFNEGEARFSPDGRWVAYVSDQTGRFEVWARPYGITGSPVRVSSDGGHEPAWSRDGRTIFYHAGSKMMAAGFQVSSAGAAAGLPHVLFDGGFPDYNIIYRRTYDVLPDGNFVVIQRARPVVSASIVVELNALRPLTMNASQNR